MKADKGLSIFGSTEEGLSVNELTLSECDHHLKTFQVPCPKKTLMMR
jgi:hypothetical protein